MKVDAASASLLLKRDGMFKEHSVTENKKEGVPIEVKPELKP